MKFIFLVATYLSISSIGLAGINTVGKGGGFAEMLAIKSDQNLSIQIDACLESPNLCKISEEARILAQQLSKALSQLQTVPLEFKTECKSEVEVTSASVKIPSCLLYELDQNQQMIPRPVREISVIILKARAQQGNFDKEAVGKFLAPIFQNFHLLEERLVIPWNENQIILHFVVFKQNPYSQEYALILEDPLTSLDITKIIQKKLCAEEKITALQLTLIGSERQDANAIFNGEVLWECSNRYNNKLRAKIVIASQIGEQMKTIADSIRVLVTHKEPAVW